eukprot:CAMPEP_0184480726 /NCGR_PEP_ID=MMETSP0113_2-20130426/2245_1 /TAXON_ID=91329 /ORGANISM="Norrisiella sphaerica, Strain BC52" /LENGTH=273 /DNA_ID=CAMNT_0026859405 /DNA_START=39 /DNA_END=857 /DNA_ORIENTATION=-
MRRLGGLVRLTLNQHRSSGIVLKRSNISLGGAGPHLRAFSQEAEQKDEGTEELYEREPWMYVDERIKPRSRPISELIREDWPEEDEAERAYVGEFMRSSRDFIREQEKLLSIKPEFYVRIREEKEMHKRASERMRERGELPCLIYGRTKNHRRKPLPIVLDMKQIVKQMKHHGQSFFVTIFRMNIEGRKEGILVKPQQVAYNPVNRKFDTMTFVRWSPYKKTRLILPVEVIGQRDCVGVKNGGAVLRPTKGVKCVYEGPGPLPRGFKLNVQSW